MVPRERDHMESRLLEVLVELETACNQGDYRQFLRVLDRHYVHVSGDDREAFRRLLNQDEALNAELRDQLGKVSEQAVAAKDHAASVRATLLGFSLADDRDSDSREILMNLAATWRWAEHRQVNPLPIYREIGEISSSEITHMVGGSVQMMILMIAEDADSC